MKLFKIYYSQVQFTIVKLFVFVLFYLTFGGLNIYSQTINDTKKTTDSIAQKNPLKNDIEFDLNTLTDENDLLSGVLNEETETENTEKSFWKDYVFEPMRFGVNYELTYKFTKPDELIKNRFSFRLEYSKFYFNNFFVQLDTKLLTFLRNDSRSRTSNIYINDNSKEAKFALGSITRNAFLQYSYGKTSVKIGIQTLVWGESDFAAVTDEINPLDSRDPLNLNIDELRLGQFMLAFNWYSSIGNWSCFFVPDPKFNESPKKGTRFYIDPFEGTNITFQNEKQKGNLFEYGIRWKKTFGKSDVSLIVTSLIDNNIAQRQVNSTLISLSKRRYSTVGMSSNYAVGNLLIKGETALKFPRTYRDTAFQLVEHNAFDATLGFEYSLNSTLTLGLELVNNHVIDWNDEIVGVPRNDYTAFFVVTKELLKSDLSLNYISMYNGPYITFFNLLSAAYKLNDNIILSLDTIIPITEDKRSAFYSFHDQQQLAFKIQLLF